MTRTVDLIPMQGGLIGDAPAGRFGGGDASRLRRPQQGHFADHAHELWHVERFADHRVYVSRCPRKAAKS